ncbi:MAG: sulfatase family protein [Candidatus Cyclobacteriaceae bacterium M3_2C_046]
MRNTGIIIIIIITCFAFSCQSPNQDKTSDAKTEYQRPNILFAISDDQSFPYASAYGDQTVNTPAFDKVASEGVLFTNAFVASPGCSPSRAAFLTGRYPWQIEQAGTHGSSFPTKYVVFPDLLEEAGYFIGATGKAWSPGNWEISGRTRNPVGPKYDSIRLDPPYDYISNIDYSANFEHFLSQRPKGQPFFFWYGASEPHRAFEKGIGYKEGKTDDQATVPDFLPDQHEIRSDLLDYAVEIEWFDHHLDSMIALLEKTGELENTLIIVTSDNGMAFPRAKANLFEYGIHVPLAIRWGNQIPRGRKIEDPVSLVDITKTIYSASKTAFPGKYDLSGKDILPWLRSNESGVIDSAKVIYAGRERHSSSRWNNLTYPQRAIRTHQYLYIRNFKPERWPAGAPQKYDSDSLLGPQHGGYHDIDAAPSLDYLIENRNSPEIGQYFHLAVDRRPPEELYDIENDPACLTNLARHHDFQHVKKQLASQLGGYLMVTEDPRVTGQGDLWESYPRLRGSIRKFPQPDWADSENNMDYLNR